MFKKAVMLFLTVGGFVFATTVECFGDVAADLKQAADYKEMGRYKESEGLYKSVIQGNPGTDSAFKAQNRLVILYIVTERSAQTQEGINNLTANFSGNPDLPDTLYWIARRYRQEDHGEQAIHLFQQIIQRYPSSAAAKKAQFDIPRTNVLSLLNLAKYSEAEAAIDRLIADFSSNPELPETLFDIARKCKMADRYAKAKSLYQYILQHYPDSSYSDFCRLFIPKMDIWAQIASGDFSNAQAATDKLITDFASDPELPDALHGIAMRYVVEEVKRYYDAQNLCQRIIQLYPKSTAAKNSAIDIEKCKIFSLMESGDDSSVLPAVDKMMTDFSESFYLLQVVGREIPYRYFHKGLQMENVNPVMAKSCFQQAAAIWEKVMNRIPVPRHVALPATVIQDWAITQKH